MNTVKASVILNDAQRLMRWDTAQLEETEKADLMQVAFSKALQEVWGEWWWEELMTCERMQLRDTYASGTTYAAEDEVYFPATRKYYQCVQATTGNAPAALDATTGDYETEENFWIEADLTRTADDYDEEADYTVGDLVRDPATDTICARLGGLIVSGAGTAAANGVYAYTGVEVQGKLSWGTYSASTKHIAWHEDSERWRIFDGTQVVYTSADAVATPDLVTTWEYEFGTAPLPSIVFAGVEPATAGIWQTVSDFDPTLEISRTVRMVARLDPRNTHNPGPYDFDLTPDGIRLEEIPERSPFVWARRVTPIIADDCAEFSATATYDATPAALLVFDA